VWTRRGGRQSLLLGATVTEIVGWPAEKGRALLDRLLAWSAQPQFTLHRALRFGSTSVRLMHRAIVRGDEPVMAA